MKIKGHLDLFSGIGGFSLALQRAGIEPDWIGYSDIDQYANQVFKRRFPNAEELGSITDIQPKDLPKIDLITFGFPCQNLSIAGKRKGLKGSRSSLFFEAMRIIRAKRPKYFIFENVKGIFSSNKGKDFDIILQSIAESGYDGQWQLCNTRFFGLPQNRERIYFVGHIRRECRPKVFPIGEGSSKNKKAQKINNNPQYARTITTAQAHGTAKHMSYIKEKKGLRQIGSIGKDADATRVYDVNGISKTLKGEGGGWGARTGLYEVKSAALRTFPRESNMTKEEKKKRGKRLELRDDDVANTITSHQLDSIVSGQSRIRRLTPKECERLQGFPDDWTDGCSDTQRYKQCGNAISVPVAEAIYKKMYVL